MDTTQFRDLIPLLCQYLPWWDRHVLRMVGTIFRDVLRDQVSLGMLPSTPRSPSHLRVPVLRFTNQSGARDGITIAGIRITRTVDEVPIELAHLAVYLIPIHLRRALFAAGIFTRGIMEHVLGYDNIALFDAVSLALDPVDIGIEYFGPQVLAEIMRRDPAPEFTQILFLQQGCGLPKSTRVSSYHRYLPRYIHISWEDTALMLAEHTLALCPHHLVAAVAKFSDAGLEYLLDRVDDYSTLQCTSPHYDRVVSYLLHRDRCPELADIEIEARHLNLDTLQKYLARYPHTFNILISPHVHALYCEYGTQLWSSRVYLVCSAIASGSVALLSALVRDLSIDELHIHMAICIMDMYDINLVWPEKCIACWRAGVSWISTDETYIATLAAETDVTRSIKSRDAYSLHLHYGDNRALILAGAPLAQIRSNVRVLRYSWSSRYIEHVLCGYIPFEQYSPRLDEQGDIPVVLRLFAEYGVQLNLFAEYIKPYF